MQLSGNGFVLRGIRQEDKMALARHANNPKIAANLRDIFPSPYTENDAANFISFVLAHNDPPLHFAIEVNDEAAGMISLIMKEDVYRLNAEIGYWLGEEHWNKGIMTAAIRLVTGYAFTSLGMIRVYAEPFATNTASAQVLEKAGYTREAVLRRSVIKNGEVLDSFIYSLTDTAYFSAGYPTTN
ncbi:MAG: GNAT family protein [Chitinophagaceae bacterium]